MQPIQHLVPETLSEWLVATTDRVHGRPDAEFSELHAGTNETWYNNS